MPSPQEDVVISGIGGYFPSSSNVDEWKQKLFANEIHLEEKWSKDHEVCNLLGSITVNRFDHSYFGIHRTQTAYMDPLHRLSLERTFEAVIDAGLNPNAVRGRKIGCYLGMTMDENNSLFLESVVSGFGVTGHSRAMLPNRISYWLNLKGPSVAYDCNWITGLEVMRLAYEAIRSGQIEAAIVGAANVAFFPEFQMMYDEMNFTSPDGTTKAFDVDARGYARSDGVVILFLQKACDAKRSYGSIMHIKTEFNGGTSDELLKISSPLMAEFLENFYSDSPIKPEQIDYVETYGCGVKDVDKAELDALETIYCQNRSGPLMIGSVKTQAGHSESCCTLFSLVKVLISMEEEMIPATLQFENPNPEIKGLINGKFQVVTKNTKWSSEYAAINGIGINNYFGHLIIKRNPKAKAIIKCDLPPFLPISTRTEETVQKMLAKLKDKPYDPEYHRLVQEVFSKHVPLHMYRGYLMQGEEVQQSFSHQDGKKMKVWFVYSGMGSQFNGMLSDFMKIPVMAQSITNSHNIMMKHGVDLMEILTNPDKTIFDNILNSFVGIAAIQIALTDLLNAIGIVPDGIIGHSVGELGCAYADGCMTAEQMILSSYFRGRASIEATSIRGMMAAVGLGYNQIKDQLPPNIDVACHNAVDSCTLSGPTEDMEIYVKELQDRGVFARLVNAGNKAYHSRYIQPVGPLLLKYLKELFPEDVPRSRKWISTSVKAENWNTDLAKYSSADYHTNNLLGSVLFEEGIKHIPKDAILIEIAPHGLLQAILKRALKECANIPLTNRSSKSGVEFLLQSLGKLYLLGVHMDIQEIYPPVEFPVSRNTPALSDLAGWNYTDIWEIPNAEDTGTVRGIKNIQININNEKFENLIGHEIKGNIVMPVSCYLILIYQNLDSAPENILFENLHFRKHLVLSKSTKTSVQVIIQICSGEFEFWSNNEFLLSGKVTIPDDTHIYIKPEKVDLNEDSLDLKEEEVYDEMKHRGYNYSGSFRVLKKVTIAEEGSVALLECSNQWPILVEGMIQQQILISGEKYQDIHLPKTINCISIQSKIVNANNKTLAVDHDFSTKIISTEGITIKDMSMTPWDVEDTEMILESVECVHLEKLKFEEFEATLEVAIQLTHGIFSSFGVRTVLVTDLSTASSSFFDTLKKIASTLAQYNINVLKATSIDGIFVQKVYPQLIVSGDEPTNELLRKVSSSDIFLFTKTTDLALTYPGIIELVRFEVQETEYSILRRVNNTGVVTVSINEKPPSVMDLNENTSWVSKLGEAVKTSRNKRVYLVSSFKPVEGYEYFVREVRQRPSFQNVRFLFNLDNFKGDFKPIFEKDLPISILQDGTLYTNVHHCLKYKKSEVSSGNQIQATSLQYLSLNLGDETIDPSIEVKATIGNIDYSGIDENERRIMGLAKIDQDSSQIKVDPVFKWEIPSNWTLQAAATVPHAYLSAYYMLNIKANVHHGDIVLIHAGCSPVGLAAITVAFSYNCHIFTTVFNMQQKVYLMQKFAFLNKNSIFILGEISFRAQFMEATMGEGARVVLNCLSGEHIRNSMECCGHLSSFIHYGEYDLDSGNSIGMARFMLNLSFYVVNLKNLVTLENETKQELWNMVAKGIDTNAIRPLLWEYRSHQDIPDLLRQQQKGETMGKFVLKTDFEQALTTFTSKKFVCSPQASYIVFGGSAENWMNVVEWLIHRGAKMIVINSDFKSSQNNLNRRLSLFHKYFGAEVVLSKNVVSSTEDISQLLSQSSCLGAIDAVFLLPSDSSKMIRQEYKIVDMLAAALNRIAPKASLISFVKTASGICQARADAGFKTFNIELRDNADIREGLHAINQIVATNSSHTLMYKEMDNYQTITNVGLLLPKLNEIIECQKSSSLQPDLVQILTEGPSYIRELAPIFIIPGFGRTVNVNKMAERLLYPTYCTVMPCAPWPIDKLADLYAEKIVKIYSKNVYNLISVSTGGALMLEIAKKLREIRGEGIEFQLFFIDSAPATIKQAIVQLGENDDYEINILRAIFNIDDTTILNTLKAFETWDERIEFCTKSYDHRNQMLLQRGLVSLKHLLDVSKHCKPNDLTMKGKVHLLRPSNEFGDCDLTQYCNQSPLIKHIEGDHLSIISHPEAVDYINFHVDV